MYLIFTFLPEIYIFFSICILFIYGITYYLSSILKFPNIYNNIVYLSILLLTYTFFLLLNNNIYYFDYSIILKTQGNLILEIFMILITILILIVSNTYNKLYNIQCLEYVILILLSLGSLLFFINLVNLIYIYLLIEVQSIVVSILLSINKNNRYSIESSIKYFMLGSYSSLLFLFGVSIIYGSTGIITIHNLSMFFEYYNLIQNDIVLISTKMSSIFILIGLLFKIYSAPFHFWLPEIYEGSPMSVLMYLSSIQLIAMIVFFIKMYYYVLFDVLKLKQLILYIISFLTLVLGSLGALFQRKIKKLISYSTITVNGFFLYAIVNINLVLLESSLMYLFIYIFMSLLLFIISLNVFVNNKIMTKLTDLFNIYYINKPICILLIVILFTLTGLPPFVIFISKLFWLKSFFFEYLIGTVFLFIILLFSNFYYMRFIKNIYYHIDNNNNVYFLSSKNYWSIWLLWFLLFVLIYSLFYNNLLFVFVKVLLYSIINAL